MSYYPPQQAQFASNPDDLDAPLYGATLKQAFLRFWKKYVVFSGRASRSEYWWWALIGILVSIVFTIIDSASSGGFNQASQTRSSAGDILTYVWGLATLVPSLALGIRRLHDTNRSGWWLLIGLIPVIGAIVLLVFYLSGPNPAGARFDRGGAVQGQGYAPQPNG